MNIKDLLNNKELDKSVKNLKDLDNLVRELQARAIEYFLEAELDEHLKNKKHQRTVTGNKRNGTGTKKIKLSSGEATIKTPRDRDGTFEPVIVPKKQNTLEHLENFIISLYAKGMTVRDIQAQIKEIYGASLSPATISRITDKVINHYKKWQVRKLKPKYHVVWLDGLSVKVRQGKKVVEKTIYLAIGLNDEGKKEILGIWLGTHESASFWKTVLEDLIARGVQIIGLTVTDNLKWLTKVIKEVFPMARTQICVIHQVRFSMLHVVAKDRKEFLADLKLIYTASSREEAERARDIFVNKWASKYKKGVQSWIRNWNNLTIFFDYPLEVRKIIYTTNPIESINKKIRKYIRNKQSFPTDDSVLKAIYLILMRAPRTWSKPIENWSVIRDFFNRKYAINFTS